MSELIQHSVSPPPSGVKYPLVLTGQSPTRLLTSVVAAVLAFVVVVPLVAQWLLSSSWLVRGQTPAYDEYFKSASRYELPEGLAATHLALASLILVAVVMVRYVHGRESRWLVSVQPGWRWRYLVVCLLIGIVALNAVLWLSFLGAMPNFEAAQAGWPWFLAAVLITSPLQAAAEEFFFRGYLLQALGSATHRVWFGVVGSAALFAVFHGVQNPALFVDRFAFGLLAGWLVVATGGLEAGIAAHVVNNVFAFGYGMFTGGIAATKAIQSIGWDKAAFDVLGFGLFAVVAWWFGKRMNLATTTP